MLGRKATKTADELIFESPGGKGGGDSAFESGGDARRLA